LFINRSEIDKSCLAGSSKKNCNEYQSGGISEESKDFEGEDQKETGGEVFDVSELIEEDRASRDHLYR